MLLSDDEYDLVWNRIYKELKFSPSMNKNVIPFSFSIPYIVYDISNTNDKMEK